MSDPTVAKLLDAVEALCAELRRGEQAGRDEEPLLTVDELMRTFRKSDTTIRRILKDHGLGILGPDGKLYGRASDIVKHRGLGVVILPRQNGS